MHESKDLAQCNNCMMMNLCTQSCLDHRNDAHTPPVVSNNLELKRRQLLYSYRDDFKGVFALQSGAIKTFHIDRNGQERIHQFYLPGEIIGLEGIHAGFYPYSAITLSTTTLCELPFDDLMALTAKHPALQNTIMSTLSHRINIGHYLTAPNAEQRLAAFLLDIESRLNHLHNLDHIFELPMSRYDIGNYLSLAPETISRVLTRFQHADLISVNHKKIKLICRDRLQWIAHEGLGN